MLRRARTRGAPFAGASARFAGERPTWRQRLCAVLPIVFLLGAAALLNIVLGAAMGLAVPLFLKSMGKDPAMGGSVLLTFMTDSGGFMIFLGLATVFFA